jgi:hypothetical protein
MMVTWARQDVDPSCREAGAQAAKFQNFRATNRFGLWFSNLGEQLSHQAKWKEAFSRFIRGIDPV